ncbi:MAG: hypothetical protein JRJ35_16105 [Deltaproteobacteria bacterium]|nr:hypothetical protein [Deltaproteobacteria bacterium]MBW1950945.1 hypothetical protein [Deltaproteobacteria bacterium]MBW2009189.1 hypothetical protein [Deltaproteobacteria bacterium]MBW2103453.1 hypothetical protein [Deltaproteobacteria bacterium]
MDFLEKARVRLEHWLEHNEDHREEYEKFAELLEAEGKGETAAYVRETAELTARSTEALEKALETLKS